MQKKITLQLLPSESADEAAIKNNIAKSIGTPVNSITGFDILKKSIDARSRSQVWINLTLQVFINEPYTKRTTEKFIFQDVRKSNARVVIIGAGPAGLFAALQLIEKGIKPIIVERGKDVKARRRDLAKLNREGIINEDSNYCFGEGGAGTYSDGKLYTRSNKRGNIDRILQLFVYFGAEEKILYEAHPHIGTNKLPHIIIAMRNKIIEMGGEIHFEKRVVDFIIKNKKIAQVKTQDGDLIDGDYFILATGHSARDIFELLHKQNILIEAKPFALGVRIEHPQMLIDHIQYHCDTRGDYLPPASYSLVQQVNGRGVFSFCMCPGGIIAPASTAAKEVVVNGWSPSKRNNPFANSGMVVQVELTDVAQHSPLSMMHFQKQVEQNCYAAGGGGFKAPAQRMVDFSTKKASSSLPICSYQPGITAAGLQTILPDFVYQSLSKGFIEFGKKMKGYYTNEAIVVATESRTSSPVRIPRDTNTLQHPQVQNLYPCGEGAGYAGGIVSAAMDGERIALQIANL